VTKSDANYALSRPEWDEAVFDNAAYFMTLDMSLPKHELHYRKTYQSLPDALDFARLSARVCLYVISATGRATILDRKQWQFWEERWNQRRRE